MNISIAFLLGANFLVPAIAVYMCCVSRGFEVNHVATFTFGYWFYWILPTMVGAVKLLSYNASMRIFYDIFDRVPPANVEIYLIISLCFYLSFAFGHAMSRGLRFRMMEKYADLRFDIRWLIPHLVLGIAAVAVYAYLLRSELFKGYTITNEEFADPLRGTFAAYCSFLEGVAFIYTINRQFTLPVTSTFWRVVSNSYMLVVALALLLDLSLGQRHFILTAIIMLVVYRSVFFGPLRPRNAFLLFAAGLSAAGAAALVRSEMKLTLLEVIFAEPLFTSLALIYFLREARFPLIRFPSLLVKDLLFIVPTALVPNKLALIPSVADAGIPLFNPLGTVHSFLSFMANFGVLGSFGVFFFLGFVLNLIKSGGRRPLLRVIYIMLSAQLAFSFWRDDFAISFVKSILEFSILIPILVCVNSNVLSGLLRRKHLRMAQHVPQLAR